MTAKTKLKPKTTVIHLAGAFYQSRNKAGDYFMGTKEKAERFEKGEHDPKTQLVVDDGKLVTAEAE